IVGTLNDALNNALSKALAGTPVHIQGGLDTTAKTLSFDFQIDLAGTITKTLSFGSGFSDLGFNANGNVTVVVSVGATLDFALGLDLSHISPTHLSIDASDFFVQFNKVQVNGSIVLPSINLEVAG